MIFMATEAHRRCGISEAHRRCGMMEAYEGSILKVYRMEMALGGMDRM